MKKIAFVLCVAVTMLISGVAPAATGKPIELILHTPHANTSVDAMSDDAWGQEITKRTGGRVVFKSYYMSQLISANKQQDGFKYGMFQAGQLTGALSPNDTPLGSLFYMAGSPSTDDVVIEKAVTDVCKTPEFLAEFAKYDALPLYAKVTPVEMGGVISKKLIKTLDDLKGVSIRCTGSIGPAFETFGAHVVNIGSPELYDALSKGTVNAVAGSWDLAVTSGLTSVAKYFNDLVYSVGIRPYCIKKSTFQGLPADIQKIILEVSAEWPARYRASWAPTRDKFMAQFKKDGLNLVKVSAEDQRRFVQSGCKPSWDKRIAELDKQGIPASKVWNNYLSAIAKYEKETGGAKK